MGHGDCTELKLLEAHTHATESVTKTDAQVAWKWYWSVICRVITINQIFAFNREEATFITHSFGVNP